MSIKEKNFLRKLNTILSTKLEDNTFTIDEFAKIMAMSRTQLFRKTKVLTNMSPRQYVLLFSILDSLILFEHLNWSTIDSYYLRLIPNVHQNNAIVHYAEKYRFPSTAFH